MVHATQHLQVAAACSTEVASQHPNPQHPTNREVFGRRFMTDGGIGVHVQAGGYMETLFWQYPQTAGDLPFGTVVQRNVLANLHDHLAGARCCDQCQGLEP